MSDLKIPAIYDTMTGLVSSVSVRTLFCIFIAKKTLFTRNNKLYIILYYIVRNVLIAMPQRMTVLTIFCGTDELFWIPAYGESHAFRQRLRE